MPCWLIPCCTLRFSINWCWIWQSLIRSQYILTPEIAKHFYILGILFPYFAIKNAIFSTLVDHTVYKRWSDKFQYLQIWNWLRSKAKILIHLWRSSIWLRFPEWNHQSEWDFQNEINSLIHLHHYPYFS